MKRSTMQQIDEAWLGWVDDQGVTVNRPRRWQSQVLALSELGIGKNKMIEFIDTAMNTTTDDSDVWDNFIDLCVIEVERRDRFDVGDFKRQYRKRR